MSDLESGIQQVSFLLSVLPSQDSLHARQVTTVHVLRVHFELVHCFYTHHEVYISIHVRYFLCLTILNSYNFLSALINLVSKLSFFLIPLAYL